MANIDPKELQKVREGSELAALLPYLEAIVAEMERAIDNKMKSAQVAGDLTPAKAQEAWIEKLALKKILTKVAQKVNMGVSAGERAAPNM